MSDEPTPEEQAQMKLRLADSVTELVREEMIKAFEDFHFWNDLMVRAGWQFGNNLAPKIADNYDFRSAMLAMLSSQMLKK